MKRIPMIQELIAVGRNPRSLQNYSNEQLREEMSREAGRRAAIAQKRTQDALERERALRMRQLKEKRRQKAAERNAVYQEEQRQAELFRQRVIAKPLPAIPGVEVDSNASLLRKMIVRCNDRIARFTELFKQTGDREHAQAVNEARTIRDQLRHALSELGFVLI